LGNIYAEEGNEHEAMNCWEKARLSDNPNIVLYTLNSIYKHYKQKNDLPNTLATLEQIHHLEDSLNGASEKAKVAEIQMKYDKQVVENRYYKVLTWTFAGAFFLLLVILLILFYHRHVVKVYTSRITRHLQTIQSIQQQIDQLEQEKQQYQSEQEKLAQAQTDLLALRSEQSVSEELLNQKEQEIKKLQASVEQYRKKIHALQSYAVNERLARICAKYFDVMSFNFYAIKPDHKLMDNILSWTNLPMIIGEFHFGAVDRGLGQSLFQVRNQSERGKAYRNYVETGFSHPGLVGVTYFTWNDEDVLGRFDGENYNCGLVDVTNVPYREQTDAMMETAKRLYQVHAGSLAPFSETPDFIVGMERGGDEW
jgi:hypothetical protein